MRSVVRTAPSPARARSRKAWCARTTPATEFRSVTASADKPMAAASRANSSGWEAPSRKLKLVVT